MSIKTAFDLERIESRWAGKERLCASPRVIWLAFVEKYLKYRSCPNLPLVPTSPGHPYHNFGEKGKRVIMFDL